MAQLQVHKSDPPERYSWVGFFKTKSEAQKWTNSSNKAGHSYPFWLQEKESLKRIGSKYCLWWYKPRKGKMIGKGFS